MIIKELDPFFPENKFEKAGYAAEINVAFYLRRFYEDDPTIHILNGIRIVKNNDAAQMDHLIIHKSGMIVVECKSVHDKIKIEEDGQWACWFDGQTKGMASPIKQAEMQADFLRKYLNKNSTKDPQKFDRMPIKILVAISNEGQFFRPKNNPKAAPEVCKMDQLKERIDEIRNGNTEICLATGARWSEAEELRISQVRDGQIHFTDTKSGKNRSVPIDETLIATLLAHLEKRYGDDKTIAERFFKFGYGAFREGIDKAELTLPKEQLTHVLRHTFASHFIMNGGNILVLQKILGHSNLTMTMRYAHLAPEHLQEVKTLNPLARLTLC